jgi:putrescine transport system substrate-binding protein
VTKPLCTLAGCLAIAINLGSCADGSNESPSEQNVVNVYNWADYIDPEAIELFEAETGIKVNYDAYDSSEVVDVKLLTGNTGYDVVIHSNRFSTRIAPLGIYEKLDMSRFRNLGNIDEKIWARLKIYEEVRGYNVPYHWGTTGYAWNADMVRERLPDHPMDSADVLFDPEVVAKLADCGVSLLDSTSDLFPMTLAYLDREPASFDAASVADIEATLQSVRPYVRYFSNTKMTSDLPNREVCLAMSWSGDYATAALRAREAGLDIDIRYTMPKEGSGLWVDGMYILADARHKDNAYRFIDFLLRADIAALNATETFYANANRPSWALLDPAIVNDPAIYPTEEDWERIYAIPLPTPKEDRVMTRAYARIKSGI